LVWEGDSIEVASLCTNKDGRSTVNSSELLIEITGGMLSNETLLNCQIDSSKRFLTVSQTFIRQYRQKNYTERIRYIHHRHYYVYETKPGICHAYTRVYAYMELYVDMGFVRAI